MYHLHYNPYFYYSAILFAIGWPFFVSFLFLFLAIALAFSRVASEQPPFWSFPAVIWPFCGHHCPNIAESQFNIFHDNNHSIKSHLKNLVNWTRFLINNSMQNQFNIHQHPSKYRLIACFRLLLALFDFLKIVSGSNKSFRTSLNRLNRIKWIGPVPSQCVSVCVGVCRCVSVCVGVCQCVSVCALF